MKNVFIITCGGSVQGVNLFLLDIKMIESTDLTVTAFDDGIRPAGKQDECFYCNSKIGEKHQSDCHMISKRVLVKIAYEIEVVVPAKWSKEDVNHYYNERYTNNGIGLIEEHIDKSEEETGKENLNMKIDFIKDVSTSPFVQQLQHSKYKDAVKLISRQPIQLIFRENHTEE